VQRWRKWGRRAKPGTPYALLAREIRKAVASPHLAAVVNLRRHFEKSPQACIEFLSRRDRKHWMNPRDVASIGQVNQITVANQVIVEDVEARVRRFLSAQQQKFERLVIARAITEADARARYQVAEQAAAGELRRALPPTGNHPVASPDVGSSSPPLREPA
jgi:hypothetical protein